MTEDEIKAVKTLGVGGVLGVILVKGSLIFILRVAYYSAVVLCVNSTLMLATGADVLRFFGGN